MEGHWRRKARERDSPSVKPPNLITWAMQYLSYSGADMIHYHVLFSNVVSLITDPNTASERSRGAIWGRICATLLASVRLIVVGDRWIWGVGLQGKRKEWFDNTIKIGFEFFFCPSFVLFLRIGHLYLSTTGRDLLSFTFPVCFVMNEKGFIS